MSSVTSIPIPTDCLLCHRTTFDHASNVYSSSRRLHGCGDCRAFSAAWHAQAPTHLMFEAQLINFKRVTTMSCQLQSSSISLALDA
eukprot:6188121-Pleurochrysis_carterae.AAC.1